MSSNVEIKINTNNDFEHFEVSNPIENCMDSIIKIASPNLGYITDIGKRKSENQDYAKVGIREDGAIIMIVADGVTSSKNSSEGARLSCKFMFDRLNRPGSFNDKYIISCIKDLNDHVLKLQKEINDRTSYQTTLVVGMIKDQYLIISWLGDSRAYAINHNSGLLLTEDDSLVNNMVKSGDINESEIENHPKKHIITQCVGYNPIEGKRSIKVHVRQYKISENDAIFLCSDGLWGDVDLTKGYNISKNIELMLMKIVAEANKNGGRDNITCAALLPNKK